MKHQATKPAAGQRTRSAGRQAPIANDNLTPEDLADPFFTTMAKRDIAATRLW